MNDDYCLISGISITEAVEILLFFDGFDEKFLQYLSEWIPINYLDDIHNNKDLCKKLNRLFRFGDNNTFHNNGKYISYSISDGIIHYLNIGLSYNMIPIINLQSKAK